MKQNDVGVFKTWVHLSDLHVYDGTETKVIQNSFKKLGQKLKPDFLIVSGDFRHIVSQSDYKKSLTFLKGIVKAFSVKMEDVFIVPGNHDVNVLTTPEKGVRTRKINAILDEINSGTMPCIGQLWNDDLNVYFSQYKEFVQTFYSKNLRQYDCALKTVDAYVWKDCLNLIFLNTAIVSNGDRSHEELIDIDALYELTKDDISPINKKLPSIIIGHHAPQYWNNDQKRLLCNLKNDLNIKAYLCGDAHRVNVVGVSEKEFGFPVFTCGKSAPQPKDGYSDVSAISYTWKNDGKVYVQAYDWGGKIHDERQYQFLLSNHFMRDIDECYSFDCRLPEEYTQLLKRTRTIDKTNLLIDYKISKAEITMFFSSREQITQNTEISFVVNSESLNSINHCLTWTGREYEGSDVADSSKKDGYSIKPISSSCSVFQFDVVFPHEMKYNESGRYIVETRVRDTEHNMVPCLTRGIKCDTDKMTLKVMFYDDLIEQCESFVSFRAEAEIEKPVMLDKMQIGPNLYYYVAEFDDLRLALRYGIRWKFKEND